MPYQNRQEFIQQLEQARDSRVVSYVLSDRMTFPDGVPGFTTSLSQEPHLHLRELLQGIGKTDRLDLFIYTRGGTTESVWPLVNMLRDYCDILTVLVPHRAHSAGTMICLGADEVVMADGSELSPIDPTTGNQFNPHDPENPSSRYGISVEDVAAYFSLAQEFGGIQAEQFKLEVLKELTREVHPLALGNVQRVYMLIRRLAKELLLLHLPDLEDDKLGHIVENLTSEFYSHMHSIGRTEAIRLLGEWVRAPAKEEAAPIEALFGSYIADLELRDRFNLPAFLGDEAVQDLHVLGGAIESVDMSFVYTTDVKIMQRPNLPQGVQVQVPPNEPVPLVPWVSRAYDYGVQRMGWESNEAGV